MSKLIIVSMLFLFSCGGTSKVDLQENKVSGEFEVIYQNDYTGTPEKSYRVVTNKEDYKAFFMEMKVDEVPEVNFEKSNVLILNMGSKTTGGYSVSPEKMTDDGKNITMVIKEVVPQSGEMTTMALTSPVCIVKINSKKEIIIK